MHTVLIISPPYIYIYTCTGSQFVECEVTADYEAGSAAELTVTRGETVMLISTETTGISDA